MIRIVLLLCICLAGPAHAQGTGFDVDAMANVQTEAIDFMLPRTLEVVTAAQLTMWGLTGLTSIDPVLSATVQDAKVQLLVRGRSAIEVTVQGTDAAPWGQAIAKVVAVAYAASPAMRQVGQSVVTKVLLNEMLAHLDPYSRYIPPIEAVDDRDRRVGHAGIGVTFIQHGRGVTVRDVVIGSPAAVAGMRQGDAIQWVDEHTAIGKDRDVVEALLNGPEGTELRLGWRARDGSPHVATMTRVMIPPETVFPRRVGDVAIIQITGFSQTTDQHVIQVVRDVVNAARPITGIVLDLRGNRGGLVRAAVATADSFLPAGVVMRSSGRAPETNRIWRSGGGELAQGVRMVVLVDGGTASAAEILAAALADRGRAIVVGSSTFGKGVVQTIDPLPDGGELFLTWSRILAPRYWPIQSLGVFPQICTSLGDAGVRRQLDALAEGRVELASAIEAHRAARAPLSPDQIVAIRGRCPAADPRESDMDVAEALVETPASYAVALLPPMADEQ